MLLVVIVGGGWWYFSRFASQEGYQPFSSLDVVSSSSQETSSSTLKELTMADVASHNTKESCYTAIRGSVYDLTDWIYKHPGGAGAILRLCGKGGTDAFEGKHGGQTRPESELAGFKIGTLVTQ